MLIKKIIDIQKMYYVSPFFHHLEMILFLGTIGGNRRLNSFVKYFVIFI
jgi:hypothetical protein